LLKTKNSLKILTEKEVLVKKKFRILKNFKEKSLKSEWKIAINS
jgi:hypothetical protein